MAMEKAARANDLSLLVAVGRELGHADLQDRAQNVVFNEWLGPQAVDGVIVLSAALSNFSGKEGLEALCRRLAPLPTCSIGLALTSVPSISGQQSRGHAAVGGAFGAHAQVPAHRLHRRAVGQRRGSRAFRRLP
ncbi:MAG: hypothetical protein QM756_38140 [Polyangiaceae bacterium]